MYDVYDQNYVIVDDLDFGHKFFDFDVTKWFALKLQLQFIGEREKQFNFNAVQIDIVVVLIRMKRVFVLSIIGELSGRKQIFDNREKNQIKQLKRHR